MKLMGKLLGGNMYRFLKIFVLLLMGAGALAQTESINLQPFYVTHSKGSYFLEDASWDHSLLKKNYKFLLYLGYTYADDPLVVIDDGTNSRIDIEAKKQSLISLGFGYHFAKNLYIGVGTYFSTLDFKSSTATDFEKQTSIGDTRLIAKWRIVNKEKYALALIPEIIFETGDAKDLSTDNGFGGGLRLAYERSFGSWADFYFNIGYLATPDSEYKNIRMHNRAWFGVGAWVPFSRKLSLNVEWNGQVAFPTDDNQNPTEFYGGLRYAFSESLAGFLGTQITGFGSDISTDFKASFALKWTPQLAEPKPEPVPVPVPEPEPVVDVKQEISEKLQLAQMINFETGSHQLTQDSFSICQQIALSIIKHNDSVSSVLVEGHTDHVGKESSNQILSENRAKSVKQCLIDAGVDANKLSSIGYGESRPKVPGFSKEAARINRRVEFKVEYK